jgi:hypothetical protein
VLLQLTTAQGSAPFEYQFIFPLGSGDNLHYDCKKVIFFGNLQRIPKGSSIDDLKLLARDEWSIHSD